VVGERQQALERGTTARLKTAELSSSAVSLFDPSSVGLLDFCRTTAAVLQGTICSRLHCTREKPSEERRTAEHSSAPPFVYCLI